MKTAETLVPLQDVVRDRVRLSHARAIPRKLLCERELDDDRVRLSHAVSIRPKVFGHGILNAHRIL